jgi:hypothetical protein
MAKSTSKHSDKAATTKTTSKPFIPVSEKAFDPKVSSLFATSVRSH